MIWTADSRVSNPTDGRLDGTGERRVNRDSRRPDHIRPITNDASEIGDGALEVGGS